LGWLVDRYSRRLVIWSGVTVWSLATVASGLSRRYVELFVSRLAVGAGEAALSPAAYSLISDIFPKHRLAFALSVYSTGATIGSALAYTFGGALISYLSNVTIAVPPLQSLSTWQLTFVALGAPGLVLALLIFLIPEPVRRERVHTVAAGEFWTFLKRRRRLFSYQFVGCGLLSLVGYGYLAWLPAYLMRHFHLSVYQAGLLLGPLVAFSGIVGGVASGIVVDWLFAKGRRDAHMIYWMWACLALVVVSIAQFTAPTLWSFAIFCSIAQMLTPFSGVNAAAVQIVTPNRLRGRTSSLFILTFNIFGLGLGASAVAFCTDFVYHDDALVGASMATTSSILLPLGALLFALARKPMREAVTETIP